MTLRRTDDAVTPSSVSEETAISPTELRALRRLAEPDAPATVAPNELWASRYRVIEPIGRGGMGDVFLARDVLLDRLVALKVLRNSVDDDVVDEKLLLREARAAARAEHERIARVYDAGTWNDRAFIAMEYVRGETLREWTKTHRPTPEEIVFIVQQLVEGVRALHERHLVHRDLKPENVMVASDGNLRILDLGIARRVPLSGAGAAPRDWSGSASVGFGVGTPGYMAPEQWQATEVDARADVFALGVIIYELVVGVAPFRGANNLVVREKTLRGEIAFDQPEWANMPSALREVARVALRRDREQRYASVDLLIEPLVGLLRPSVPPISGSRTSSLRPPEIQLPAIDSSQASALGVSVVLAIPKTRRLSRKDLGWLLAGVVSLSALAASALHLRSAAHSLPAPPPGMVRLQGGTFKMGSDAEDLASECARLPKGCPPEAQNEVPLRQATVLPFEIDEHEVTNQAFVEFLNDTGPSLRVLQDPDDHYDRFVRYFLHQNEAFLIYDLWPGTAGIRYTNQAGFAVRPGFEQLPVVQVTWLGARLFCKDVGKRIPTEAEWEFAARGVERRAFPWGSRPPNCDGVHIASKGWLSLQNPEHCDNARETPFPVMSAAQDVTPEGVKDLAGNVAEWVDVDDSSNNDEAAYAKRLTSEQPAVFRGGAFNTSFMTRSASRKFRLALDVGYNLGFRCAKPVSTNH